MASPQLENGYVKIANEIMEALAKYRLPGEQRQILDVILRKTYGYCKKEDMISNSQFVKYSGMLKGNVCRAVKGLIDKNIVIKNDNKNIPSYRFNKNYETWKVLSKKQPVIKKATGVIKKDNKELSKVSTTKEKKETITKESPLFKFQKKVPMPLNLFLTDKMKKYVSDQGGENGIAEELFEDFCNYHGARGTKFQDWNRAFQTWVRKDMEFNPSKYQRIIYD